MKIIVPVKSAAALEDDYDLAGPNRVDEASLDWDTNEWDTFSLEAALQLRDASGDGEVVVLTVGGPEATDTLLMCLALGADRAAHIQVDDPAGLDSMSVASLLAASIKPEQPDLVLCGVQSSDGASGATGVALAALLELPWIAVVRQIECDGTATATVHRELEGGLIEVLRVGLPALLTVQTGINEPRYASLRGIRQAKDKPRALVTPDELGFGNAELHAAAGSRLVSLSAHPAIEGAEMLEGSADAIAGQIATLIRKRIGS